MIKAVFNSTQRSIHDVVHNEYVVTSFKWSSMVQGNQEKRFNIRPGDDD